MLRTTIGAHRCRSVVRVGVGLFVVIVVLGACGYDWTVIPKGKVTKDGAAATTACKSDKECPSTEYCTFPDRLCGLGGSGECTPIPTASSCSGAQLENVCTCDGLVSKSPCDATVSGLDLAKDAVCKYDLPNTFRCGFAICSLKTYCLEFKDGDGFLDYQCLPFQCAEQSCSCKETTAKCPTGPCEALKGGGVIVRCGG